MKLVHYIHLSNRAGFSMPIRTFVKYSESKRKKLVSTIIEQSQSWTPLKMELPQINPERIKQLQPSEKKKLFKRNQDKIRELNGLWLDRMVMGEHQLRERMTYFWSNHFVVRDKGARKALQYNNILRKYALGNFRDLLIAVSQSPSMLDYLNNKQNRKGKPNENFARELMELFTLGTKKYTEKDIKEAARAFTGWNYNFEGDFVLRQRWHDNGIKEFFGQQKAWTGEQIIDRILEEKQCARHICGKIYKHFVSDTAHLEHIEELANVFYSGYDIAEVMEYLFNQDWFYAEELVSNKIKSPVELLVGMQRQLGFKYDNASTPLLIQRVLGEVLLRPPNVAGHAGGRTWINSNTLTFRMRLSSLLLNGGMISTDFDIDDLGNQGMRAQRRVQKRFGTHMKWTPLLQTSQLLGSNALKVIFGSELHSSDQHDLTKSSLISALSRPEYQLA